MRAETRWESGGEAVREAMGDETKQGKLRGIARLSSPSQLHHVASLVYLTGRLLSTPGHVFAVCQIDCRQPRGQEYRLYGHGASLCRIRCSSQNRSSG